ncbi:Hypothetical predicted protein [Olea europaea subsp. europaea]|uniref:Uncharacterized protein n=1 Tax=Olea europaea subsp. europaea TaxID=158383 RepID=A0A8S0PWL8_OLEEU|nr:Hypothetical predicted protein [Olea europaea subsp. europaea]
MEFKFRIPEDARLRAHNLKYVKIVMDHFDERQREDFRNSSLSYLAQVPDIQFSAQLIQHLLFRTVRTDKEYALVTGLRCGAFPEGATFDRLVERRRLKERCQLHGFRGTCAKKFQKTKRRKEKEIAYMVHGFPIAMQVWTYKALPEVGEHFAQQVGERLPRLLHWSARKQPQHRMYDAFFKNVKIHVYATLRPTDAEAQQPYFSTLVPYDDLPVQVLDDIARTVVTPKFNASDDGNSDDGHAAREDSDEEVVRRRRPEVMRKNVCSIAIVMVRTLRILASLTVIDPAPMRTPVEEIGVPVPHLGHHVHGGPIEPCPDEQDIAIATRNTQDVACIVPCQDDVNLPVATLTEEVQDVGAKEPSNATGDDDEEVDGCDATDGDGVITEVPAPRPVPEARVGVPTTRQRSAWLRRLAIATRTPYTGGGQREPRSNCYELAEEHDDGLVLVFGW